MKTIDFSKPGGFPLTQDHLNYLQTAYKETITALAKIGGTTGPFVINGMAVSSTSTGAYDVAEGWFFLQWADDTCAGDEHYRRDRRQ